MFPFNLQSVKNIRTYIAFLPLTLILLVIDSVLLGSCREKRELLNQTARPQETAGLPPLAFDIDAIRQRGRLVAILTNSSTGYFIYHGQPMGYEYELLNRLASDLQLKLDIKLANSIEEATYMLNMGEGDIIAFNMAVTAALQEDIAFTEPLHEARQVLVQRNPEHWRHMKYHQIEESLIRNPLQLEGKEVHVAENSAYAARLENLEEEIGGDIDIVASADALNTEALIRQVAQGEISYTVASENVATVNATYYPNLDVSTFISFPQKIAWATRRNAPGLLASVNDWLQGMKKQTEYYVIYNKYFKSPKTNLKRVHSDYYAVATSHISPYDAVIKQAANDLGWDWRLLVAQVYQESRFNTQAASAKGALGLMQLLPATGQMYGATDMLNPEQSLRAGVAYLIWLDNLWKKYIPDHEERIKFVLASYNAGQGHVLDARRLAKKYGKKPDQWDGNVAYFLEMKSKPKYYKDPVATSGYCRGTEPINYVEDILSRYESYKHLVKPNMEEVSQPLMAGI